jgi:hypothetical protein
MLKQDHFTKTGSGHRESTQKRDALSYRPRDLHQLPTVSGQPRARSALDVEHNRSRQCAGPDVRWQLRQRLYRCCDGRPAHPQRMQRRDNSVVVPAVNPRDWTAGSENASFCAILCPKNASFYQDRLGTTLRECTQKERCAFLQSHHLARSATAARTTAAWCRASGSSRASSKASHQWVAASSRSHRPAARVVRSCGAAMRGSKRPMIGSSTIHSGGCRCASTRAGRYRTSPL